MALDKKTKKELIEMLKASYGNVDELKAQLEESKSRNEHYAGELEKVNNTVEEKANEVNALHKQLRNKESDYAKQCETFKRTNNIDRVIIVGLIVIYLITICVMCG